MEGNWPAVISLILACFSFALVAFWGGASDTSRPRLIALGLFLFSLAFVISNWPK